MYLPLDEGYDPDPLDAVMASKTTGLKFVNVSRAITSYLLIVYIFMKGMV
jgi:hypothetical protein